MSLSFANAAAASAGRLTSRYVAPHQLVDQAFFADQRLKSLFVEAEILGLFQCRAHRVEEHGGVGVALCQYIESGELHFELQLIDRRFAGAAAPHLVGFVQELDRLFPIALLGLVHSKPPQQRGIGAIELGQFHGIAQSHIATIKTVGQRHRFAQGGGRLWIEPGGPDQIAERRGELLPRFERAARGEQRRGVEMVLLGLGSRVQLNQRLRAILENLRRRFRAACPSRGDGRRQSPSAGDEKPSARRKPAGENPALFGRNRMQSIEHGSLPRTEAQAHRADRRVAKLGCWDGRQRVSVACVWKAAWSSTSVS